MACVRPMRSRASRASRLASSQLRKSASAMGPYLMTSARPASNSRWGRVSRVSRSHSTLWLVERPDHVLAGGVVDGGFAPRLNRPGPARSWGPAQRHATHVARGGKTGHVAHHAAAQAYSTVLRSQADSSSVVNTWFQRRPIFIGFAVRQFNVEHLLWVGTERLLELGCVQRPHGRVGHDQGGGRQGRPANWAESVNSPWPMRMS